MPCESFRTIGGYDVLRSRALKGRPCFVFPRTTRLVAPSVAHEYPNTVVVACK
jgi:hypothetical protein